MPALASRVGDLLEERATLVTEAREILTAAEGESRDLTSEERQEYDRREERIREIEGDVRRHQEAQRAENLDLRVELDDAPEDRTIGRNSDEYREALGAYARGAELTAEQRSTLNTAADPDGGFAVPEHWGELIESLRDAGTIREHATIVQTAMGGSLHVPFVSADATAPVITAEQAAIADDGETFAEKVINAFKFTRITKASDEMAQDSLFDVPAFVGRRLGFDLGRAANADYVNGNGAGKAEGLFFAAPVGKTLASTAAITGDEIIDLHYSVTGPYRKDARYVANDTTIAAIRKIKGSDGQYIWQPALAAGQPDLLLGRPIESDPDVLALGAVNRNVLGFGNVARAYMVRDVLGVTIKFLQERYADNGQVAWRGTLRTGGAVVDANAFKVARTPAV